jgi:hypothetical protein
MYGFGIRIGFLIPEFLSCKQILDNIKDEIKNEAKLKQDKDEIKISIPTNFLDDDSV